MAGGSAVRDPRPRYVADEGAAAGAVDAHVIALFDNELLRRKLRQLEKVEIAAVRRLVQAALARAPRVPGEPASPTQVHRRIVHGLPGEALLISSALFLDNLVQAEDYFGLSFKTLKARLGGRLDITTGERALRAARAALAAAQVFGSLEAAREYLHTRNFALGGATPAELLKTAEGERIVLDELHAQAEGAPL